MTLGVVIEIDVYVSSFLRQAGYQSGILRELLIRIAGSVARRRAVTPDITERSEHRNLATKFWRIGQTNRPARLPDEIVDLVGEPALMTQLYYHPETFPPRQRAAQAIEAVAIRLHLRRKLKQYGSSFVAESRQPGQKELHALVWIFEPLDVSDEVTRFNGENESLRHSFGPAGKSFRRWQAIEGVVDFYGAESLGIEGKPMFLSEALRIETPVGPMFIIPSTCANEDTALHCTIFYHSILGGEGPRPIALKVFSTIIILRSEGLKTTNIRCTSASASAALLFYLWANDDVDAPMLKCFNDGDIIILPPCATSVLKGCREGVDLQRSTNADLIAFKLKLVRSRDPIPRPLASAVRR